MAGLDDIPYVPLTTIPAVSFIGTSANESFDARGTEFEFQSTLIDMLGGDDQPVTAGFGDDVFIVGAGFDKLYASAGGFDTALFAGNISGYSGLIFTGSNTHVVDDADLSDGNSGRDRLVGFERFEFADAIMNAKTGEVTYKTGTGGDEGLVVTTLGESTGGDGEISLREAVATANASAGSDTITFAEDLRGQTLMVTNNAIEVTGDLVIDGGSAGQSGGPITINALSGIDGVLEVSNADLRIEDVTFSKFNVGNDSAVIEITGGELNLTRTKFHEIGDTAGSGVSNSNVLRINEGAQAQIHSSLFDSIDVSDDTIDNAGNAQIHNTQFVNGTNFAGGALSSNGYSLVRNSLIDNQGGYNGTPIWARGTLVFENSTIRGGGATYGPQAIGLGPDSDVIIRNSTVVSSGADFDGVIGASFGSGGNVEISSSTIAVNSLFGNIFGEGDFTIANSIVLSDDNPTGYRAGRVTSLGNNIVDGIGGGIAIASDITGVTMASVFQDIAAGDVLALDNGGPTPTAALRDAADNPALDHANPASSPSTDQRGQARDTTPDAGAFELQNDEGGDITPAIIDFTLALGVTETGEFGNKFNGQSDADGVISAAFENTGGDAVLSLLGFDVDFADEVRVSIKNDGGEQELGFLSQGPNNEVNGGDSFIIGAEDQQAGINTIIFEQTYFDTYKWGITDILLDNSGSPPPAEPDFILAQGVTETGEFGNKFNGQSDADGVITAAFENTGGDAVVSVLGFDVDFGDEVRVSLKNDDGEQVLGFLSRGPNNEFNGGDSFIIAAEDQQAGTNTIIFEQTYFDTYKWGVTDILIDSIEAPPPPPSGDTLADLFPATEVLGTAGIDDLNGTAANELVEAFGGDDSQHGHGGNDFVVIGPGRDKNFGGPGFDVAVFNGDIGDFSGVSGVSDVYLIDDLNTSDGDLGFDRVKAFEILAFDDALFDSRTGNSETFSDSGALVTRLEALIATEGAIS